MYIHVRLFDKKSKYLYVLLWYTYYIHDCKVPDWQIPLTLHLNLIPFNLNNEPAKLRLTVYHYFYWTCNQNMIKGKRWKVDSLSVLKISVCARMRVCQYVYLCVCVCVCVCVCESLYRLSQKVLDRFWWNLAGWCRMIKARFLLKMRLIGPVERKPHPLEVLKSPYLRQIP